MVFKTFLRHAFLIRHECRSMTFCAGEVSARIARSTALQQRPMNFRPLLLLVTATCALALASCKTPYKESDKKREEKKKDMSGDHSFQSFVGRLRIAVKTKDHEVLAQMMSPNFGYRWDTAPEGETAFSYWETNKVWPELEAVLQEKFVPYADFMVAPPKFAEEPNTYPGYRAGLKQVNGSWQFVYFVPAPPDAEQALGQ